MAESTSTPSTSNTTCSVSGSSCFQRTVCLYDWWLVKAENEFEGKRLAVSGITSRKNEAQRVFVSAPVTKRYDVLSLETADGIYIMIKGFINEQRTLENGIFPEVFNNFLFGFPPNWESYATNCFRDESTIDIDSGGAVPENISVIEPEILSNGVEKSIPTSLKSPEEAFGAHKKTTNGINVDHASKETTNGVNVTHGCNNNRRCTRMRNIKVCPPKHADKEQHSSLGAVESLDEEGLRSLVTPVQSQSLGHVDIASEQLFKNCALAIDLEILHDGVEKSIPTSSKSLEEALGDHEKSAPEDDRYASKEKMHGVNVAHGSGSNRRRAKLRNNEVRLQKKLASVVPAKHPNKEQCSLLGALENPDRERLRSPVTPVQSQSHGQIKRSSDHLVKKFASRVTRSLSENSEGCFKKRKVTVEIEVVKPKGKMARSASAVKYPRESDASPLIKGGKEKLSSVSPLSSSFKKSRSGRLLLPPLEFWRNQIPVYNADHQITEIQEGASVFHHLNVLDHY